MDKSTISMVIVNSFLYVYQRVFRSKSSRMVKDGSCLQSWRLQGLQHILFIGAVHICDTWARPKAEKTWKNWNQMSNLMNNEGCLEYGYNMDEWWFFMSHHICHMGHIERRLSDDCHAAWSSEVQAIHSPVPQQSFPGRTNRVSGSCPRPRFSWKQDFLETGHGPSFGEVVLHLSAQDLGY